MLVPWIGVMLSMQAAAMKLDSLTVGSLTYSNVTVLGVNASDLFFNSDRGIRNVKLRLLTPDMQQKFNYDPEAAKKAEDQQAEDEKRYHDNLAAQIASEFNAARDARDAKAQAVYAEAGLADRATGDSPIGKVTPDLNLDTWVGAKPKLDNKFAIVSVWSPKSPSSRKWIPALNALYKNLSDRVQVLGVTPASVADVNQSDPKPEFPVAIDPDGKFLSGVGVDTFPFVMLLDTNHVVRFEGHPAALTQEILQNIFKKMDEENGEATSAGTSNGDSAPPAANSGDSTPPATNSGDSTPPAPNGAEPTPPAPQN